MKKGRDPDFDGSYETSRFAKKSLEEDIIDAGKGKITGELPGGGTFRQTDTKIDVWVPGKPGDYTHHFYNAETGECDSRSGKR